MLCMLQPIEAALNICCGGYTALVGQFKEAGDSCDILQTSNLDQCVPAWICA